MASSVRGGLSEENIRALFGATEPGKLAPLHFQPPQEDGAGNPVVVCYLVRCRSTGFMTLMPGGEQVQAMLDAAPLRYAYAPCDVTVATNRGRNSATVSAFLVDADWDSLEKFARQSQLRGEAARNAIRFKVGASPAAPLLDSAVAASDSWIYESMAEDTAAEYTTAEEDPGFGVDGAPLADGEGGTDPAVVEQLQNRILELEARLASQPASVHPQPGTLGGGLLAPTALHSRAEVPLR